MGATEINLTNLNAHLAVYDTNKDGKLDETEIAAMRETTNQVGDILAGAENRNKEVEEPKIDYSEISRKQVEAYRKLKEDEAKKQQKQNPTFVQRVIRSAKYTARSAAIGTVSGAALGAAWAGAGVAPGAVAGFVFGAGEGLLESMIIPRE